MPMISRRSALGLVATSALFAKSALAAPASVPSIWEGEKMYNSFAKDGTGFSYPGPSNRPKAYVAFDTQCPDCVRLLDRIHPLFSKVEVFFFPIAYLNIHSEPQGALLLSSKNPSEQLDRHHEHFRDPGFRGLRYDASTLSEEIRNKVWMNTKLHRRCGCRAVPYGVFKNSKGQYVPFDENLTTDELAQLFEVTL